MANTPIATPPGVFAMLAELNDDTDDSPVVLRRAPPTLSTVGRASVPTRRAARPTRQLPSGMSDSQIDDQLENLFRAASHSYEDETASDRLRRSSCFESVSHPPVSTTTSAAPKVSVNVEGSFDDEPLTSVGEVVPIAVAEEDATTAVDVVDSYKGLGEEVPTTATIIEEVATTATAMVGGGCEEEVGRAALVPTESLIDFQLAFEAFREEATVQNDSLKQEVHRLEKKLLALQNSNSLRDAEWRSLRDELEAERKAHEETNNVYQRLLLSPPTTGSTPTPTAIAFTAPASYAAPRASATLPVGATHVPPPTLQSVQEPEPAVQPMSRQMGRKASRQDDQEEESTTNRHPGTEGAAASSSPTMSGEPPASSPPAGFLSRFWQSVRGSNGQ